MSVLKQFERTAKVFLYEGLFRRLFRNEPVSLPLDPNSIKRVLLIRRDMIGDMIIASSGIRYLNELLPDAKIDIFCAPKGKVILEHNPRVEKIYTASLTNAFNTYRTALQASKTQYDLILALTFKRTTQDGFWANIISRTAIKAAIEIPKSAEQHRQLFNALVDIGHTTGEKPTPLYQNLHRFIAALFGAKPDERRIVQEIFISAAEKAVAENFLTERQQGLFIVFNISARLKEKEWHRDHNLKFLQRLTLSHPELAVLVSADPDKIDAAKALVAAVASPKVNFISPMPLRSLAHLISKAVMLVSPDTALVHVAATFNVASVMMCTGKHSGEEFEPQGEHLAVWAKDAASVDTISPEQVFDAFEEMLARIAQRQTGVRQNAFTEPA
ncbi:MAG: glycosyltransferase family 9 protein [Rhizobacter sp.]|nr:glycosyltransferase family 9 protein [Chlorobiales bacterium]